MTLLPKGPFEFWQAGFRSPSPLLMAPGRRLFTVVLKVIPSADTGLWEGWSTLSHRLLDIVRRQVKSLHTLCECYFCGCIVSTQGSWIDGKLHLQRIAKPVEQMSTRGKEILTWLLVGCVHTTVILSPFLCTSAAAAPPSKTPSPLYCDSVNQPQMFSSISTHRQAFFPLPLSVWPLWESGWKLSKHVFFTHVVHHLS